MQSSHPMKRINLSVYNCIYILGGPQRVVLVNATTAVHAPQRCVRREVGEIEVCLIQRQK